MRLLFWLFLLPLFAQAEVQQDTKGEFGIMASVPTIGEAFYPFTIEARFSSPPPYHVDLDSLTQQLLFHANPLEPLFELVDQSSSVSTVDQKRIEKVQWTLRPLREGSLSLFLTPVSFISEQEVKQVSFLMTPFNLSITAPQHSYPYYPVLLPLHLGIAMEVTPSNQWALMDSPQALQREAERNRNFIKARTLRWFPFLGFLLFLIAFVGWKFLRSFYKEEKRLDSNKIDTLQQLKELIHRLEGGNIQSLEQRQPAYDSLIPAVRSYLEDYFKIPAQTQTSEEILTSLKQRSSIPEETLQELSEFFRRSDQARFALSSHEPKDLPKDLNIIKKFTKL